MKKILTLILFLAITAAAFSQSVSHMKFMGIPINGTITQFQAKLTAKGCTYDKRTSSYISSGTRAFKGNMVGNKATIFVYYNTKTKIVYRVKAVINRLTDDIANQKLQQIKGLLSIKYDVVNTQSDDYGEAVTFMPDADGTDTETYGRIDLYLSKDAEDWINQPYYYNIHIDYYDTYNSLRNDMQQLDEL